MTQIPFSRIVLLSLITRATEIGSAELFHQFSQIPAVDRANCGFPAKKNNLYADLYALGQQGYVSLDHRRVAITEEGRHYVQAVERLIHHVWGDHPRSQTAGISSIQTDTSPISKTTPVTIPPESGQPSVLFSELDAIWAWCMTPEKRKPIIERCIQLLRKPTFSQEEVITMCASWFEGIEKIGTKRRPQFDASIEETMILLQTPPKD